MNIESNQDQLNLSDVDAKEKPDYEDQAKAAREKVLASVFSKGLLPPNLHLFTESTATRNGTVLDKEAEESGISCALIFSEQMNGVSVSHSETDDSFSYTVSENGISVSSDSQYVRSSRELSNPKDGASASTSVEVLDAIIDGVLYGKAYFGGMHSILPVMAERREEHMADNTRYLSSDLLSRRFSSSVLIVASIKDVGIDQRDKISQTEYRVNGRGIAPDDFLTVLVPEHLADEISLIQQELGSNINIKIVKPVEKRVPIAHAYAEALVPNFEDALRELGKSSDDPLIVHGVRLLDETDFIFKDHPSLKEEMIDVEKILEMAYGVDPNSFGEDTVLDLCEKNRKIINPDLLGKKLRSHPGYKV